MEDTLEEKVDAERTHRFWRIRKTIFQMGNDRGYLVTKEELEETMAQFMEQFGDHPGRHELTVTLNHKSKPDEVLAVFFIEEPKVGIKKVNALLSEMRTRNFNRGIMIVEKGYTPAAKKSLASVADQIYLEMFIDGELMFNVTEHELVPKHIPLSPEEKADLLKTMKIKDVQLPRILSTDPVARYLGMRRGNVVKIIRPSETAGLYMIYRLCV